MAADRTLIRVSLSISSDDGAGRGNGEPVIVQPDQNKEYVRNIVAIEAYHQFSANFGAGIVLPYADLHLEDNANLTEGDSSGFGDARVYALWTPWADEEPNEFFDPGNLSFVVGLTLPTATDVFPDLPIGRDGQLGGASLDLRLGVTYWGNLSEEWAIFGTMNLQLDTGDDYLGYRNAPAWSWRIGGGWTPVKYVSVYATFRANYQDNNHDPAGDVPNTGGTFWYVAPSVVVRPIDELWIDFMAAFPVYHRVHGDQILPGTTWMVGVSVNF